jgi:hypothetical protein
MYELHSVTDQPKTNINRNSKVSTMMKPRAQDTSTKCGIGMSDTFPTSVGHPKLDVQLFFFLGSDTVWTLSQHLYMAEDTLRTPLLRGKEK